MTNRDELLKSIASKRKDSMEVFVANLKPEPEHVACDNSFDLRDHFSVSEEN